jgi:hypothetical protein
MTVAVGLHNGFFQFRQSPLFDLSVLGYLLYFLSGFLLADLHVLELGAKASPILGCGRRCGLLFTGCLDPPYLRLLNA